MTTTFEVWPPKGDRPILTFTDRADALAYVYDRRVTVPGLLLFEAITTIERREIGETQRVAA